MDTADRLIALLDHLGLATAHFATQMPGDLAGLAARAPGRMGGVVLAVPVRLDPGPFEPIAGRLLMLSGDAGLSADVTKRAEQHLGIARRHVLTGYAATGWSDLAADRTAEVGDLMSGHLGNNVAGEPRSDAPRFGTHAGLSFRIDGHGPALLLLPFFLAASQWDPLVETLARHFSVVRVGGAHIGGVATLEDRAAAPTYQAMFTTLCDLMQITSGHRILDVGCGSGALDRLLARKLGATARIDAVDVNGYLLGEAKALADADDLGERILFGHGSAVDLPFPDATFDRVLSVTVLEECDAGRAIAEIARVTKPGGRIGIVVRAIDLPQWWNVDVAASIKAKADVPPQSIGPGGVADKSLYGRIRKAGLVDLIVAPQFVTLDRPDGPTWRYREDHLLSLLTPDEAQHWKTAATAARASGVLAMATALHCAVATKPSR